MGTEPALWIDFGSVGILGALGPSDPEHAGGPSGFSPRCPGFRGRVLASLWLEYSLGIWVLGAVINGILF